jgi:hypothetical protein
VSEQLVGLRLEWTPQQYHADKAALSASGARKLLASPARFRYELDHPRPPTRVFDLGHAAHRVVLGAGDELDILDYGDYRTKAAQGAARAARAMGKTPVLTHEWAQVREMHAAVLAHPLASRLLTGGQAEAPMRWIDDATGIPCRALVDYLRPPWLVDYKTTESASREHLARAVRRYGYHVQAWWYLDGARALELDELPAFVFIAQEKTPPFLVRVFDLADEWFAVAAGDARRAREMFRDCSKTDLWPGYPNRVATIDAPRYLAQDTEWETDE